MNKRRFFEILGAIAGIGLFPFSLKSRAKDVKIPDWRTWTYEPYYIVRHSNGISYFPLSKYYVMTLENGIYLSQPSQNREYTVCYFAYPLGISIQWGRFVDGKWTKKFYLEQNAFCQFLKERGQYQYLKMDA